MLRLTDGKIVPNQKVVPAAEYQAYLDGQAIIEDAKEKAAEIIAAAEEEYERQKLQGHEDGLREGRMQMSEQMIDAVTRSVDYFAALESQVVGIVVKALRKIVGDMDQHDRIVSVVRNALSVTRGQAKVSVRVSPAESETVEKSLEEILRPYPSIQFIEVIPDSRLNAGGCILETEIGVVDASVDVQLRAIENALEKTLGSHD